MKRSKEVKIFKKNAPIGEPPAEISSRPLDENLEQSVKK